MQQPAIRTAGGVEYQLTRKPVKNLNLRVRADGTVAVSAPRWVSAGQADAFVAARAAWVRAAQSRMRARAQDRLATPAPCAEDCLRAFSAVSERVFPLFCEILGGQKPVLKVRDMRTRWGSCHVVKRQITLASRLALQPAAAIEYVVVHEYCHFVYPDHQAPFWALVERILPDYRARRALLRAAE